MLLVEDDDVIRGVISHVLNLAGIRVEHAPDGAQGVAAARTGRFHLILMDIQMPTMDGVRALALIRRDAIAARTPVIMLTNNASITNVSECLKLGAVDFVVKRSFKPDVLVQRVRKHLLPTCPASGGGQSPAHAPSAAAVEDENPGSPPVTLALWKQRAASAGTLTAEQTRAALASVALPLIHPPLVQEVLSALQDTDRGLITAAKLIELEPALILGILQAAQRKAGAAEVADLELAEILGQLPRPELPTIIRGLAGAAPPIPGQLAPWFHLWWRHALATARVAHELAILLEVPCSLARLSGMMHNLGSFLLLASPLGVKLGYLYEQIPHLQVATDATEQVLLGLTHQQAASEFCERASLPAPVLHACRDSGRPGLEVGRMVPSQIALITVLNAADQVVRSIGWGPVGNDELTHLPPLIASAFARVDGLVNLALEDVEKTVLFRLGDASPAGALDQMPLAGINVALLSTAPGPWNVLYKALARAQARVRTYQDTKNLILETSALGTTPDVLIIDGTAEPLGLLVPQLRPLAQTSLAGCTKLLLAQASDNPALVLQSARIDLPVFTNPIRICSFLSSVHALSSAAPRVPR